MVGTMVLGELLRANTGIAYLYLSLLVLTIQPTHGWLFDSPLYQNLTEFQPYIGLPDSPLYRVLRFLPTRLKAGECRADLLEYLDALNEGASWALNFYDASTKYPDGVLFSNGYNFGQFDQCLETQTGTFSGKYCLVNVQYSKLNSRSPVLPSDRFTYRRNEANVALCLPSSCQTQEITRGLQESISLFTIMRDYHVKISIPESNCQFIEPVQDESSHGLIWYAIILGVSALALTNLKKYFGSDRMGSITKSDILETFDIPKYWNKLITPSDSEENIHIAHGLRFAGILIVIIGHRMESVVAGALLNPRHHDEFLKNPASVMIINGQLYVEIFFTLSGFLLCWKILKQFDKNQPLGFLPLVWQRFIRLVPAYAVAIFLQASVLEKLGSGPLWKLKVGKEAANCRKNWWANLLFINNFWDPEHICVDPSWYLACDFQLLFVGILIVQSVLHWKRNRFLPLIAACIASVVCPFVVNYRNGLDALVIPDASTAGKTSENDTNNLQYITTYCRAGSYIVGILAAFVVDYMQKSKLSPSHITWKRAAWAAFICSYGTKILGIFFISETQPHPIIVAIYAAINRPIFAIGIAYLIIASTFGKLGFLRFLSSPVFLPLSRITYSMYLTHSFLIQLSQSWLRSPQHASDPYMVSVIASDFLLSTILGTLFYLFVECPSATIIRKLTTKSGTQSSIVKNEEVIKSD